MTPVLVTVILTVFKRLDFLPEALASALSQRFNSLEIIVADDSGCAAARSVCQAQIAAGQIRYRANPQTLGIASSLRAAVEDARGVYIAILNDDDAWAPDFLTTLVPALEADARRVLAFSDHWMVTEQGQIDSDVTDSNTLQYGRSGLPEGEIPDPAHFVVVRNGVPLAMASVFRKNAVDWARLTDDVSGAYDFWISCMLAASGGTFYYVPRRLTRYRVHSRMETGRRSHDKNENHAYIFALLLREGWFPQMERYLRGRLARALLRVGRDKLHFHRLNEARRYMVLAVKACAGWI